MAIAQNQIRQDYTSIINVSATAPLNFSLGDIYYNTTTDLLHTAIKDDDNNVIWGPGEAPLEGHLYLCLATNVFYGVNSGILVEGVGSGSITNPLSTDLDVNSHYVINLSNGVNARDAVNKSQLDTKANITDVILATEKGIANGVAELDANGIVPDIQLPVASSQNLGLVKPDGTTTTVDIDGVLSAIYPESYRPFILQPIWSDHLINQVSWLRADTFSWQSGSVYTAAYNHLVNEITPVNTDMVFNPSTLALIDQRSMYRMSRISYRNPTYDYVYNGVLYCAWAYGSTLNIFGILADGWFTTSPIPQAGDTVYVADNQNMSDGIQATPWTLGVSSQIYCDNIDNIHFPVYYKAADGHKICTNDDYANALYNYNGVAWYFVLDTANTRFKLPRTKFGFTGLRNNVGDYVDPGLPNITGSVGVGGTPSIVATGTSGAFAVVGNTYSSAPNSGSYSGYQAINFYASRSSSVYGNSSTVQPPATQMYLYFYVGNFAESSLAQTAGLNAELFNDKASIDANNFNSTGKANIANLAMPSWTKVNLTPGASGEIYTAPASGYFVFDFSTTGAGAWIALYVNGQGFFNMQQERSSYGGAIFAPCNSGGTVMCNYSGTITLNQVYFMKSVGA